MIEEQRWQPIPGTTGAEIYPFIRKPDVCCSNAYLIRTPGEILVIDTGADAEQMDEIAALVEEQFLEAPRPVFLFITHCHLDHCLQACRNERLRQIAPVRIAVQETGARALASADRVLTLADLYGWEMEPLPVHIPLLAAVDRQIGGRRDLDIGDGLHVTLLTDMQIVDGSVDLYRQRIPLRCGDTLEVYHTPGHTHDSICIRFGELLFISDLLFSAGPGIAGLAGWDHAALLATIERVRWILQNEPVSVCCSGHGRAISAEKTHSALERLQVDASGLAEVGVFDRERLDDSLEHAIDLLQEANRIFAVIAGRLYMLSYCLEELGEVDEAGRYQQLLESDQIDAFLADFSRFAGAFYGGEKLEVQLVLKAVQIIQRIEILFFQDRLNHIIDSSLLRRADRLLTDFLNTVFGYRNTVPVYPVDLQEVLRDLAEQVATPPFSDEAFINAADDEEAYRAGLISRIAYIPLFENVDLTVEQSEHPLPLASTNRERFCDEITGILDDLAVVGARSVRLSASASGEAVRLAIRTEPEAVDAITRRRIRFYQRNLELCGATLAVDGDGGSLTVSLPVADTSL
jgi:glyoxylase-like metal-dependent hydrolase (beta-lactamase superfamily II)